ncbi:MAG: DUF721 domain-containing protein [Methylococcaceae bacterium]|nr:DUF721 domain-containing protein [Methylococcaceae bacterium]
MDSQQFTRPLIETLSSTDNLSPNLSPMYKHGHFKPALSFQNRHLSQFDSHIRQQKILLEAVRSAIPKTLTTHVQHTVLTNNKLLIYTDSAAWAAQLRFYEKAIMSAIASFSSHSVSTIQLKLVLDPIGPSAIQKDSANLPASKHLEILRHFCLTAPDNELTHSLMKLTNTLERLSASETGKNTDRVI